METRLNVLKVYKKIIKISNGWKIDNHTLSSQGERNYIKNEARDLFKLNKNVWVNILNFYFTQSSSIY